MEGNLIDSPELNAVIDKYSPFLKEIKRRLIFILSTFIVSGIAGFIFHEQMVKFLIRLLSLEGINIVFTSPFQFINLAIASGASVGLVFTFPLIIFQIMSFLRPALTKKEFRTIVNLFPFSIVLFLVGFVFGALIMKWQIQIFLERSIALGIGNVLDISRLLSTVILTSVFMGAGFQFPIVLFLLMRVGVLNQRSLSKKRHWIYLASFIFAVLLPADSILADIFLSMPLIFLFEVTLILNRIFDRKKAKVKVQEV